MDLITTHINADFDALACLLAAKKLYPEAIVVLPGFPEKTVREFLTLNRHIVKIDREKDINLTKVTRLIVVDTRNRGRIGKLGKLIGKPGLIIHTYDHHPQEPSDIKADKEVFKEVGATVTILVEILKKKRIKLSPIESTLLMLGIYEDTGSLTFSSTSISDINAVSFLLSCGANLNLVSDFINRQLTSEQIKLVEELIHANKNFVINNVIVNIAGVKLNKYIHDLALLTHKLRDMENLNVIFTVVEMDGRVLLVGRSKLKEVDVLSILREFGGGGHTRAASAMVKGATLNRMISKLKKVLAKNIKMPITVGDLMSSPVKTVEDKVTISRTHKIMLRFGHNCLPITRRNKLVGIITREDVDKAMHHGFGQFPVRGYMRRNVITIKPEAPLYDLQKIMLEHDIGHLPVLQKKKLIGVVTRTDLLKLLNKDGGHNQISNIHIRQDSLEIRDIKRLIDKRLSRGIRKLLVEVGKVAEEITYKAFIVGGFVRDLLLDVENLDIDIVIEGDGIVFARVLAKHLKGSIKIHKKFGTAVITLKDGFKIDIATARVEFYEFPAALPKVEYSSIKQDLYRRDFTVNAMAISLNPSNFGELFDFFGGQKDLREGTIKVLYNLSFVEDPTRIIRAIRFEQRYGFRMDADTEGFIKNALSLDLFDRLANQRVRDELMLILSEEEPVKAIQRMEKFGILKYIHPRLKLTPGLKKQCGNVNDTLFLFGLHLMEEKLEKWLIYFLVLTETLSMNELKSLGERLKFTRKNIENMLLARKNSTLLIKDLAKREKVSNSTIYHRLDNLSPEILVFVMSKTKSKLIRKRISDYLTRFSKVKTEINGKDLKRLGFKEGPAFKKILRSVLDAKLNGKLKNRGEELKFVIDNRLKNV